MDVWGEILFFLQQPINNAYRFSIDFTTFALLKQTIIVNMGSPFAVLQNKIRQ